MIYSSDEWTTRSDNELIWHISIYFTNWDEIYLDLQEQVHSVIGIKPLKPQSLGSLEGLLESARMYVNAAL